MILAAMWLQPARAALQLTIGAGLLVILLGSARADGNIVVEAHTDQRPANADRILAPLRRGLEAQGDLVQGSDVIVALGSVGLEGVSDGKLTAEAIAAQIDVGVKSYVRGEFQVSAAQLREAVATAQGNSALVVADDKSPQWMTRGLAALALSRARLGDAKGAAEAMTEQLRSFPALPVTVEEFGPDGSDLYVAIRKSTESQARGGLVVNVSDPNARIFVNELGRGRGSVSLRDLLPGTYRVLVQGASQSRRYTVAVSAGAPAQLSVSWEAEASLVASPRWVGFVVPRARSAKLEEYAGELARKLGSGNLVVLALSIRDGKPTVQATVFAGRTGLVLRRKSIDAADPTPKRVEAFAREVSAAAPSDASPGAASSGRGARVATWPTYFFAAAALAAGGAAYLERDDEAVMRGLVIYAVGAVITSVGVYFDVRARSRRRSLVGLHPSGSGGVATLGWEF